MATKNIKIENFVPNFVFEMDSERMTWYLRTLAIFLQMSKKFDWFFVINQSIVCYWDNNMQLMLGSKPNKIFFDGLVDRLKNDNSEASQRLVRIFERSGISQFRIKKLPIVKRVNYVEMWKKSAIAILHELIGHVEDSEVVISSIENSGRLNLGYREALNSISDKDQIKGFCLRLLREKAFEMCDEGHIITSCQLAAILGMKLDYVIDTVINRKKNRAK
jgi:hypothetical protein